MPLKPPPLGRVIPPLDQPVFVDATHFARSHKDHVEFRAITTWLVAKLTAMGTTISPEAKAAIDDAMERVINEADRTYNYR